MLFRAYCFKCEKTVSAFPVSKDEEFWSAVAENADVEVIHLTNDGDHRWKLNNQEKENLRKTRAKGLI
jgi:hypothetical protein